MYSKFDLSKFKLTVGIGFKYKHTNKGRQTDIIPKMGPKLESQSESRGQIFGRLQYFSIREGKNDKHLLKVNFNKLNLLKSILC